MTFSFDYQVYKLSPSFYSDYPYIKYPEILKKGTRAYNCILIDLHLDYFICLPFRTEMNHSNGYHFKTTVRSTTHKSGIDYSKMVIISETNYLVDGVAIDRDEYLEMVHNINKIVNDASRYLEAYILHKSGKKVLHPNKYLRKYGKSTLPYFDSILL